MGKLIDLTDRTFDMLTVIKRVEDSKPGRPMWSVSYTHLTLPTT